MNKETRLILENQMQILNALANLTRYELNVVKLREQFQITEEALNPKESDLEKRRDKTVEENKK